MPNTCTMCNTHIPKPFEKHSNNQTIHPEGGLHLAIHTGYDMFTDPMDDQSLTTLSNICLCHDCSIRIIDMFPQEFKDNFFAGGHPVQTCTKHSITHPQGCHYSWT